MRYGSAYADGLDTSAVPRSLAARTRAYGIPAWLTCVSASAYWGRHAERTSVLRQPRACGWERVEAYSCGSFVGAWLTFRARFLMTCIRYADGRSSHPVSFPCLWRPSFSGRGWRLCLPGNASLPAAA